MNSSPTLLQTMAAAVELHKQHRRLTAVPDAIPDAVPRSTMTKERVTLPMRNNVGGRAPELVIMKRISTSEQEEQAMPSNFSTLLRSAISNLEAGRLDEAEHLLTKAERMVDVSTHHHYHYPNNDDDEEDDGADNGDFEDTWSKPANAKAKYNNASKRASNNNNNGDDDEPDDDEDDNNHVAKSDYAYHILGGSKTLPEPKDTPMRGGLKSDTYQLSVTPATRAPREHKFDRLIEHVQQRDNCSKATAMSTARQEYPDVFEDYQSFLSDSPTNEQHARRAGRGVAKAMPESYETLVSAEMRKGCSWRTAEQRVVNVHGSDAFNANNRMIKRNGPSVTAEFSKRADQVWWDNDIDRCEALRRTRKSAPWLYRALNST
jgi:hypothetical protein